MNKKLQLDKVLKFFCNEEEIPEELEDKIIFWKKIVFNNSFNDVDDDVLIAEDKFLRLELINRKLTDGEKLKPISQIFDNNYKYSNVVSLWKGDITTIYADVLVNSTSSDMQGLECKEGTLDYDIFLRSGMRLRLKCKDIMNGSTLECTDVLVTRAYNLPSDFLIHVVVPSFYGENKEERLIALKMCYLNVLECAKNNMVKTLVLPCLGTGSCGFDFKEASKVAIEAVTDFIDKNENVFDKIIFNVYDDTMYDIYKDLFIGDINA